MKYISGVHALNLACSLDTSGDWHASALRWDQLNLRDSRKSVFGDYGIEVAQNVPENPGKHYVANHIRACLDLIEEGRFSVAQSMRRDFICNDKYNDEIFAQVFKLRNSSDWEKVRNFMKIEYRSAWLNYERSYSYV